MAALSDTDRAALSQQFQSDLSQQREALAGLTKADIRAAVDAADDWANTNAASFNTALPQPARGALSNSQKARLNTYVVSRRWNVGA